ncbi:hypothetical protein KTD31_01655 [Burkholderia multivorans]|uniref:hypothetical protein n=1 Tax=Burkholderia multivorans TaxID=87883 RepID=UPI001C24B73A|nr:hypothetical protein [Burkholderia multivorans]MBU9200108.1 hypothetical protein [Burkholderia multivorans]
MNFFTRIDYLNLVPGNKTAGFVLAVSTQALKALAAISVTDEEVHELNRRARERVSRAGLLPATLVEDCGFELRLGGVPSHFWVSQMFGGSIGARPEELSWLSVPEKAEWLGEELEYSPHNVDTPAQALVLVILSQTWAEWAQGKLRAQQSLRRKDEGHVE